VIGGRRVHLEPVPAELSSPVDDGLPRPGLLLRLFRDQRVAFLLVGGLNTVISLAAFTALNRFVHIWGGDAAVLGSQLIAIPCAFVLHRRFVFRVIGHVLRDLGRFALVNAIPISVNLAVLPILTKGFGVPVLTGQVSFTVVWVIGSYFLHRGFSFRRTVAESSKTPGSPPAAGLER
jgi:putative flippase GtrA